MALNYTNLKEYKIIFLDIDGVLNRHIRDEVACSNIIEYAKIILLNKILLATDARIVLSSAWRYIFHRGEASLIGLDWLLRSHGMACVKPPKDYEGPWNDIRIVGVTDLDTLVPHYNGTSSKLFPLEKERGKQITNWLTNNKSFRVKSYVVIDDGGYDPETHFWNDLGIYAENHPTVWCRSYTGLTHMDVEKAIYALNK